MLIISSETLSTKGLFRRTTEVREGDQRSGKGAASSRSARVRSRRLRHRRAQKLSRSRPARSAWPTMSWHRSSKASQPRERAKVPRKIASSGDVVLCPPNHLPMPPPPRPRNPCTASLPAPRPPPMPHTRPRPPPGRPPRPNSQPPLAEPAARTVLCRFWPPCVSSSMVTSKLWVSHENNNQIGLAKNHQNLA